MTVSIGGLRRIALVCTLALTLACSCSPAERSQYHIGVTQIVTHPGIDQVRDGFIEEMGTQGFVEGENVTYDFTNANGDITAARAIASRYAGMDLDLIFSISTPSTQALKAVVGDSGPPIVFGAITDPVEAGIVASLKIPGDHITGTTDVWPVREQLALLKQLVPSVSRVGIVHNPAEANSRSSVRLVREAADALGLQLELVSVASSGEVAAAARSLLGRIDAFYVPADNTVISALPALVAVSERHHVPLMPGDTSNVELGGFGTLGHDYHSIGAESARMAASILRGTPAGQIPVKSSAQRNYYFNLRSARATGVEIPDALLRQAAAVYGQPTSD